MLVANVNRRWSATVSPLKIRRRNKCVPLRRVCWRDQEDAKSAQKSGCYCSTFHRFLLDCLKGSGLTAPRDACGRKFRMRTRKRLDQLTMLHFGGPVNSRRLAAQRKSRWRRGIAFADRPRQYHMMRRKTAALRDFTPCVYRKPHPY